MNDIILNNGIKIPQLGYGVFRVPEEEVQEAVLHALDAGYRSIDTAQFYRNEQGLGEAIKRSNVPREDLFITTKVWNSEQGFNKTMKAFEESLNKLKLDYLDMYLIHWPTPKYDLYLETFKALEKLYADGLVKAIGVCNFHEEHLQRLLDECDVVPVVNQIECHPYLQQKELKAFCNKHLITIESWAPLRRGGPLFEEPIITDLSKKYNKTPAQIVLRWHMQEGSIAIPKSVTPSRMKENIDVFDFELTNEDMIQIATLDKNERLGSNPENMNILEYY